MTDERRDQTPFGVGGESVPVGPGQEVGGRTSFDPTVLDFGHYAGKTIDELAQLDPDYLQWLARHPSGARYRAEISRVLGPLPVVSEH